MITEKPSLQLFSLLKKVDFYSPESCSLFLLTNTSTLPGRLHVVQVQPDWIGHDWHPETRLLVQDPSSSSLSASRLSLTSDCLSDKWRWWMSQGVCVIIVLVITVTADAVHHCVRGCFLCLMNNSELLYRKDAPPPQKKTDDPPGVKTPAG